jgi:hypothetical protein
MPTSAAALAVYARSRFEVSVPYTVGSLGGRGIGKQSVPPVFDEYQEGTALAYRATADRYACAIVQLQHTRPGVAGVPDAAAVIRDAALGIPAAHCRVTGDRLV